MIRQRPSSTLFPTRRSSDLAQGPATGLAPNFGRIKVFRQRARRIAQHRALPGIVGGVDARQAVQDRKSTRLNSSHGYISYAVFCLKKKKKENTNPYQRP